MPYRLPDGRMLAPNKSFELNGFQYLSGVKKLSQSERSDLGIVWVDPEPAPAAPPPSTAQVTAHAESVIEQGVTINVTGITEPVHVQGRDKDTRNVQGLVTAAQLRLGSGDTTTLTDFRDGNNITHQLLPAQVVELWQKSAAYITVVYQASWSIKADDPIAQTFRDDPRWPDPDQTG